MRSIRLKLLGVAFVITLTLVQMAGAQQAPDVSQLALPGGPVQTNATPRTLALGGDIQVVVRLTDAPLAAAQGRNAKKGGGNLNAAQQRDYVVQLGQKQDTLLAQIRSLGGRDSGKLTKALNAVVVTVPASLVPAVAALPGVLTVRPLHDYQLDLSQTVPYIGAAAVQSAGVNGTGVRVAVLDTGIDYTHKFFGGAGTAAAYQAAYGTSTADPRNTTTNGLFPTSKVVGGFDFVGEKWPNAPLAPDPDPIDCGPSAIPAPCAGGHGTHVADIIAGNDGGSHKGVAPGASLYAVKVCSSVSNSCSGVALLEGMDFALDPNGDGDISDAVDVVNMSLGAAYGQKEDDLSAASANAVNLGIVVVAAAGNNADRPYITSSPASTPEVISAAQTQVPSAIVYPLVINSPASIAGTYANTSTVDWAPIGAGFTSKEVAFVGRGCPDGSGAGVPAGG